MYKSLTLKLIQVKKEYKEILVLCPVAYISSKKRGILQWPFILGPPPFCTFLKYHIRLQKLSISTRKFKTFIIVKVLCQIIRLHQIKSGQGGYTVITRLCSYSANLFNDIVFIPKIYCNIVDALFVLYGLDLGYLDMAQLLLAFGYPTTEVFRSVGLWILEYFVSQNCFKYGYSEVVKKGL